ncbi:MAG: PspA/IM30 family protein [Lachnospiraceae bacterium]|nr:PspA/IM30 family protein [Lachnospiraceae bacterium]
MSILSRFNDIIKSNINAILDKYEDPSKLVDQYLIDLSKDLAEVKEETATVMAEEKRCKKALDENQKEMDKYVQLARKALEAGNEEDARVFLASKQKLAAQQESLQASYDAAKLNSQKMRQLHDKLTDDIQTLKTRKESIKSKVSVAKTQEKVNKYAESADKYNSTLGAFSRMEEKADQMLNKATAMGELNEAAGYDKAAELEKKYRFDEHSASVESDLAALKEELGL